MDECDELKDKVLQMQQSDDMTSNSTRTLSEANDNKTYSDNVEDSATRGEIVVLGYNDVVKARTIKNKARSDPDEDNHSFFCPQGRWIGECEEMGNCQKPTYEIETDSRTISNLKVVNEGIMGSCEDEKEIISYEVGVGKANKNKGT